MKSLGAQENIKRTRNIIKLTLEWMDAVTAVVATNPHEIGY